jgi:tetratricopeptide (TPR) repeat protein
LYANRRYLVDWTETSELGATAARLAGHAAAEARLRSFSSRAWLELGDRDRARSELDTAFSLVEQTRDTRLFASVHEMDGRYHEALGDHLRAMAAFRRSLDLFASVDDRRGAASLTYFIGCAQQALGEREQAQDTLTRAFGLLRAVGDAKMVGRALISIGRVLVDLGREDDARSAFEDAAAVLDASGDLFHESWAHEALADQAERTGDRHLARQHVARILDLHTRLGSARVDELTQRLAALD